MSAGSSSQDVACFSDDRTKYLMLSKSMPDRSLPQLGIGFLSNSRRPLRRSLSIHSGSLLRPEMSRTTAWDRPRRATEPAASGSAQPNWYRPRPSISRWVDSGTDELVVGPVVGVLVIGRSFPWRV